MPLDPGAASDPVTAEALRTGFAPRTFGRQIVYFDSVESTNKTMRQAAARGAAEGTVVIADQQTAGRGRLNRTWASPAGVGIYMSILLRPEGLGIPLSIYTFLPAVAAARAMRQVSGLPVFIHWPNDLMLRGAKVAGILTDVRSAQGQPREVIIGIGINVNHTPADLPGPLQDTATSLAMAAGRRYSRAAIVQALLGEFEKGHSLIRQGRSGEILNAWRKLSPSSLGTPVVVMGGAQAEMRGVTRGVEDDGTLLVEGTDGITERISFGEIRRVRGKGTHASRS